MLNANVESQYYPILNPNNEPNIQPNIAPNIEPNIEFMNPNIEPNIEPNIQPILNPIPKNFFAPPQIYIQRSYVSQCTIFRDTIAFL